MATRKLSLPLFSAKTLVSYPGPLHPLPSFHRLCQTGQESVFPCLREPTSFEFLQ